MDFTQEDQLIESLFLELRRGTIILSVLSLLDKPQYGYSLVTLLEERGLTVDAGTLYPLLRRLEKQELLTSSWDTEGTKPRKYYEMSEFGKKIYSKLCIQWLDIVKTMNKFINEEGK
jgi:DNA-binding PadR family transcriptional regulator